MKKFFTLAVIAVLATSCLKSDPFMYTALIMGNIENDVIKVDGGVIFNIVSSNVEIKAKPEERVVIMCDVLEPTGSAENEFDVRLLDYSYPVNKAPFLASAVTEGDAVGADPIKPIRQWFAGGYYNLQVAYYYKVGSEKKHEIDLVYDDVRSHSDTLFFTLHHNAFGETLGDESVNASNLGMAYDFATFPIREFFPADKESVVVQIKGDWYQSGMSFTDPETEPYEYYGVYYKSAE